MSWLEAIILGLVEGITEFLPVSSTGHLILTQSLLGLKGAAVERHIIIIQGAAILAVCWEFRKKLLHTAFTLHSDAVSRRFLLQPVHRLDAARGAGPCCSRIRSRPCCSTRYPVAIALVVGGVIILWAERRKHEERVQTVDELTTHGRGEARPVPGAGADSGHQPFGRDDHRRIAVRPVAAHGRGVFIFCWRFRRCSRPPPYDIYKARADFATAEVEPLVVSCVASFISALLATKFLLRVRQQALVRRRSRGTASCSAP